MSLASVIQITDQDVFNTSASRGGEYLGQLATTPDGRTFAYSKAGAVALAAGKLTQAPAAVANDGNRNLDDSFAVGENQITVVLGGTATQDQYAGGYFYTNDNLGQGSGVYPIVGNTAATAGNSNTTVVTIAGALNVALDTTSDVTLLPNPQSAVVVSASGSAPAVPITGAPVIPVTAGYYFWNQVGGYASILSDGAITKNAGAIASNAVDGAAEIEVAGTVTQRVGFAPELTVDTEYSALVLTLAG